MMKNQSPSSLRDKVVTTLKINVFSQDFIPQEGNPAYSRINNRKIYMPAYIPYIGLDYFRFRPRIMCYAINQNLSRHRKWSAVWTSEWANDFEIAVDRLNLCYEKYGAIPIKPYTEGFIPLAAAIALKRFLKDVFPDRIIDQVICVTNFVQFSTSEDASSSSIPNSWWRECSVRYVHKEISFLKPDIILTFGNRTKIELYRVLHSLKESGYSPIVFPCRFPGRIPSVKSRKLTSIESELWSTEILPLVDKLQPPPLDAFHSWRMLRFPGYFVDLFRSWNNP